MNKIFLDTNIILDYLLKRDKYNDASKIFDLMENDKIECFISANSLTDIYFILRKTNVNRKELILYICYAFNIISLDEKDIINAIDTNMNDFEDAIQYILCKKCKINYLITNNKKDFKNCIDVIIFDANEYIKKYNNKKN